jgi:hypothetical protein
VHCVFPEKGRMKLIDSNANIRIMEFFILHALIELFCLLPEKEIAIVSGLNM